ncbi:MAG: hypothetical protein PHR43_01950 [Dehalococcoidales bacterium]|nr:hypothetical protein [Dehalococcoidales bacterium]
MRDTRGVVSLAFKAVALAMAVVTIVMIVLGTGNMSSYVMFLSIGLFAIALAAVMDYEKRKD